jgi:LCP family protein required for cell wall assembly
MIIKNLPRSYRVPIRSNRPTQDRLAIGLAILFVIILMAILLAAFNFIRNLVYIPTNAGDYNPKSNSSSAVSQPTSTVTLSTGPLQPNGGPTPQAWDGKSRINVLILGLDHRDWQSYDIPRSDTMILLTLDPASNSAGMLSIPRDMWVDIPGHDAAKINTAYFLGEAEHLPGGGPGLAMKTVSQFLGAPINNYVQIDFVAFSNFVDKIGGISIDVPEDITVDPLGPGNTVTLKAGTQHLFGPVALAYARARYTANGDFDRANRQQQVIIGIRNRVLKPNVWPTLIAHAPGIYQDLAGGINTNLTLDQVVKLALIAQKIPVDAIKHSPISPDMITFSTSYDGQDILLPNMDLIHQLRDQFFAPGSSFVSIPSPNEPTQAVQPTIGSIKTEAARISVQNGTGSSGLAARTSDYLKTLGLNVVVETNADLTQNSMLVVYSNKPLTIDLLAKTLNISPSRIYNRQDANANVDIALVLGNDWDSSNPMPPQ